MSKFRSDSSIETIASSCPICHGDAKGNDEYLYYCQKCNILFKKSELILSKDHIENVLKEKIAEKFDKDKDKLKIEQPAEKIAPKELSEKKQVILTELKASKKYYVSRKSNILHVSNCPYGKNIKKENKIILKSLEGLEQLKRCKCMSD